MIKLPAWLPTPPRLPSWWPVWLCLSNPALIAVAIGVFVGAFGSWYLTKPPKPWLEFHWLVATYALGGDEIVLTGAYDIHPVCEAPVIWRTEAIATDGQVASYAPIPAMPSMAPGKHQYRSHIPLLEAIKPDGWVVRILITCPGAIPETVSSPPARVVVMPQAGMR